jgi:para-nitrobenzyl esterase
MTTIDTRLGRINGIDKTGLLAFRGIRFAESPTDERRFLPPVPASSWQDTYDATEFPNRSMQAPSPEVLGPSPPGKTDEDCLFLNIVTPSIDGNHRPVLFWIHGGGFTIGSANEYDGSVLAGQGDVVVVTINYRLGLLGFLDLSACGEVFAGSASNGFRDQILALEWVRDNIADYGGDPGNVTIFGESAGGSSVHGLLAAPSADGLYHRAIAHSPGTANIPSQDQTVLLADRLGVEREGLVEKLREMSAADILALQIESGISGGGLCIDGSVITRSTNDAILDRGTAGVPLIAGSNLNEGTLFTSINPDPSTYGPMGQLLAGSTMAGDDTTAYIEALKSAHPGDGPREIYERIWVDMFRRSSTESTARATVAGPGGWLYRFDMQSQMTVGDVRLGATHAAEISFTFNIYNSPDAVGLAFYDRNDPAVRQLAEMWSNTVIAFARTGDPNGAGLPEWPRYSKDDRRCLILDEDPRVEGDLDEKHRKIWENS